MDSIRSIIVGMLLLAWVNCIALPNLNPIANSDIDGFVRLTKVEFPMSMDNNLRLFYLEFITNPSFEPGMFGAFWHMPVFDSKVEQSAPNELKWYAPNGFTYYFCAHSTEKKGKEIISYVDNTSAWKAIKKKNGYEIISLIDDTSHTYVDGFLTELTLEKKKYQISYLNGKIVSVKERSGQSVFSFEYHKDQKHLKSIKNYEGIYKFEYHARKTGDILSGDNFYGQALLLSSIEYPGKGNVEKIEYNRVQNRSRSILLKDLNETMTSPLKVNRMAVDANGESKGWIEWCATTGIIMADSGGQYMIGNDKSDSFFPNFKPGQGNAKFSAIKYFVTNMTHPQIYMFDYDNYYEILGDSATGEMVRHSKIGACGPLKMKTRKVEKLLGSLNNGTWALIKANSFDNCGRLVREFFESGNENTIVYTKLSDGSERKEKFVNGVINERRVISATGKELEDMRIVDDIEYRNITNKEETIKEEYVGGKLRRRIEFLNREISKVLIFDDTGVMTEFKKDTVVELLKNIFNDTSVPLN